MTTAFVLSGGGSLGAVQVGMLQALAERRVTPDLLVGTSAGALNAVFVAAHGMSPTSLDLLAATWAALRRDDVFPLRAPQMMLALAGARDAVRPALGPGGGRRGGRHAGGRDRRRPALRDRVSKAASWPCPGPYPGRAASDLDGV
jgi:predicted acylesterase/phospholipase RssA